jgi:hypothetical protein
MKKKSFFLMAMLLFSVGAWAQENIFTLGGGYVFGNIEDYDQSTS